MWDSRQLCGLVTWSLFICVKLSLQRGIKIWGKSQVLNNITKELRDLAEQPNKDPVADTVASQVLAKSVIFLSDSQNILLGIFVAKQHFWIAVSG